MKLKGRHWKTIFKWRQRRRFHGGKTRELWLKKWINTNFLHKMANAHKKVIWIKKISLNDEMLSKEAIIKECGLKKRHMFLSINCTCPKKGD